MVKDTVSNALNCIMNAIRAKRKFCTVPKSNLLLALLGIMKSNGYVKGYNEEGSKIAIEIGGINECRAIKPRLYVGRRDFDKYIRRFLPARDFGILVISTSSGLITHRDAVEKGVGGSLIAYCF